MHSNNKHIPLAKTDIGPAETAAVTRVMHSARLALGPEITAFEQEFSAWHRVAAAAMVNSGTSALICALRAVGVKPGDEVILPALTFIGTANAISNCGALPVLVDVCEDTGNIDPDKISNVINKRTRAVVPVHLFGRAADMEPIVEIAQEHQLAVIEDAAEALGSELNNQRVGTIGDAGIFGFYPNKVLTTGEGGMVISDDTQLIERARSIANQGRACADTGPGFSFRSTELAAALGRSQLQSLSKRISERVVLAAQYNNELSAVPGIEPFGYSCGVRSWFTFPVLLPAELNRAQLMHFLSADGITTADYFPALQTLSGLDGMLKTTGDLAVSEDLGQRLLCLPFWPGIQPHLTRIAETLARGLAAC